MQKFRIEYKIAFVAGNLEGIETDCHISYPVESLPRVCADFQKDIDAKRVMGNTGSKYIVKSYEIVML